MWEALRQATDEARALSRPHAVRFMAPRPALTPTPRRAPPLTQELERDPTVMVMGEDVGHYGGSYKARRNACGHRLMRASDAVGGP